MSIKAKVRLYDQIVDCWWFLLKTHSKMSNWQITSIHYWNVRRCSINGNNLRICVVDVVFSLQSFHKKQHEAKKVKLYVSFHSFKCQNNETISKSHEKRQTKDVNAASEIVWSLFVIYNWNFKNVSFERKTKIAIRLPPACSVWK